jgi:hypothetical protein
VILLVLRGLASLTVRLILVAFIVREFVLVFLTGVVEAIIVIVTTKLIKTIFVEKVTIGVKET